MRVIAGDDGPLAELRWRGRDAARELLLLRCGWQGREGNGGVRRSTTRSVGEGEHVEGGAGWLRRAASFAGAWWPRGVRALARSGECAATGTARGNGRGSALRQAGRASWAKAKAWAR